MTVSEWGGDSGTRVPGADVDASGSAAVDPGQRADASGNDDSGDLSGREEAAFALAQVLDPDAFKSRTLPLSEAAEVLHRQEVAMSVSLAAVDAGYRLVSEDDTTVERIAQALWSSVHHGELRRWDFYVLARAAVRALREEQA